MTSPIAGEGWSYQYDDLGHMTTATNLSNAADSQSFTYDGADRILASSRYGAYTYPSASQPRPHAPSSVNGVSLSYDLNGNVTQAVADLRQSYESRPPDNAPADYLNRLEAERLRTRGLLIDALTASLVADFAGNKEKLAHLEALIETDQERALYLRVLAAGLQSEGRTEEALASYFKLAGLKHNEDELEDIEPARSVRRG